MVAWTLWCGCLHVLGANGLNSPCVCARSILILFFFSFDITVPAGRIMHTFSVPPGCSPSLDCELEHCLREVEAKWQLGTFGMSGQFLPMETPSTARLSPGLRSSILRVKYLTPHRDANHLRLPSSYEPLTEYKHGRVHKATDLPCLTGVGVKPSNQRRHDTPMTHLGHSAIPTRWNSRIYRA